jgi:primosomal protein N' (replication factor Y) (superfamily II helicase)
MPQSRKIAEVVIPTGIGKTLHYSVPPALEPRIQPGMRVRVPLGPRQATGYVVGWVKTAEVSKLRDILEVLDETPFLDQRLLDFTRWAADYYLAPWGRLLQYAIPPLAQEKGLQPTVKSAGGRGGAPHPPATEGEGALLCDLTAGRQIGGVRTDEVAEGQDPLWTLRHKHKNMPAADSSVPRLAKQIEEAIRADSFKTFLLQGHARLPIYLHAITATLNAAKSCLLLVPEIRQVEPIAIQVKSELGVDPMILHSELNPRKRLDTWLKIKTSKDSLVIGTRSAVFAPISNLGLIIVEDEQDSAYKQEESPRYHARDLSLVRAREAGATVLLGSDAPSLESYYHAQTGKYQGLLLTEEIPSSPRVTIVDLRESPRPGFLSEPLKNAIIHRTAEGSPVALFINRRGFASGILCRDCGYTSRCPACDIAMAYHKEAKELRCHYCGRRRPPLDHCPDCRGARLIVTGSGTERVVEEVRALLPDARIERLDWDRARGKKKRRELVEILREKKTQIVIGTQLLLSWPGLESFSLIGMIWTDQSLNFPDFRAGERTFQLLTTLMRRSHGEVILQTYTPDHPAIRFAVQHDYAGFIQAELPTRKALGLPPYNRLIRTVVKGRHAAQVQRSAESLATTLRGMAEEKGRRGGQKKLLDILGPAPAPLSKLRGRYRWHLLLRGQDAGPLHAWAAAGVEAWSKKKPLGGIRLEIDVDPLQML